MQTTFLCGLVLNGLKVEGQGAQFRNKMQCAIQDCKMCGLILL